MPRIRDAMRSGWNHSSWSSFSLRGPLDTSLGGDDGIHALLSEDRHLDLSAELLQLVDRSRTLEVGGDEGRRLPLLAQHQRELRGGGRLARALEACEQDHGLA